MGSKPGSRREQRLRGWQVWVESCGEGETTPMGPNTDVFVSITLGAELTDEVSWIFWVTPFGRVWRT